MKIRIGVKGWDRYRQAPHTGARGALGPMWIEIEDDNGGKIRTDAIAAFQLSNVEIPDRTINGPGGIRMITDGPNFITTILELIAAPEIIYEPCACAGHRPCWLDPAARHGNCAGHNRNGTPCQQPIATGNGTHCRYHQET